MSTTCEKSAQSFFIPLEEKLKEKTSFKKGKMILLAGPTACGKSALSLMLAESLGGEIISADSMQVYRGMDIGTAKVTRSEQQKVTHHLIDIRDLHETFNVVDFYYEAKQCCESILARDKVPIVVGGSGFYFRTLLYGPPDGPPSIPELRHSLKEQMHLYGNEALYQKLAELDPEYAQTITCNDRHKIVRALEIISLSGKKVSSLSWERREVLSDFIYHPWFLYRPRVALYPRIDERCEQMLADGLLDEVKKLETQGLRNNPTASQAIGYKQCLEFLSTNQSEAEYKRFVRKFKAASRQYAKRQFTWFRKEPLFRWLNVEAHDFEIARDLIIRDFQSTQ